MRKYFNIAGVIFILAVVAASLAYADRPVHGSRAMMRHGMGMVFPVLLRGVDLTETQKAQIKKIMASHHTTVGDLVSQMRALQGGVESKLLSSESIKETELTSQIQQLSQLSNQLADENLKVTLEIRKLLTPEQLAQAAEYREQMQARRSEMKERFRHKRAEEHKN